MRRPITADALRAFTDLEYESAAYYRSGADPDIEVPRPLADVMRVMRAADPPPLRLLAVPMGETLAEGDFLTDSADVAVVRHSRYLPAAIHSHGFIELSYVYAGTARQMVADNSYTMQRGDTSIVAPGLSHTVGVYDDESILINILVRRSTFDKAFFDLLTEDDVLGDFFGRLIYQPDQTNPCIIFHAGDDQFVRGVVEQLVGEAEGDSRYRKRMLNLLVNELCTALVGDHEAAVTITGPVVAGATRRPRDDRIVPVLQYISAHAADVTLDDVARRFGYSDAHLSRLIKLATGQGFGDITRTIKVRKAAALLANPAIPVDEIVTTVGYTDVSHFYRTFKKFYAMTPIEYRKAATARRA
jgi:AraC-like DNA-binding protein